MVGGTEPAMKHLPRFESRLHSRQVTMCDREHSILTHNVHFAEPLCLQVTMMRERPQTAGVQQASPTPRAGLVTGEAESPGGTGTDGIADHLAELLRTRNALSRGFGSNA